MAQQNKKVKDEQNLKNNVEKRAFLLGQASQSSHFMNSVLKTRGIFSCAIDTFLEIWLRIINPVLVVTDDFNSYFVSLLKTIDQDFKNAIASRNDLEFRRIRVPIWNYVKLVCPSFRRMNCDAQFSEIFRSKNFAPQFPGSGTESAFIASCSDKMKENFFSIYKSIGFCSSCDKLVTVVSEVFLNYLSIQDFSGVYDDMSELWSYAILFNNYPHTAQCRDCEYSCQVFGTEVELGKFLFIELSPILMDRIQFPMEMRINGKIFRLSALVRNKNSHFTCAVNECSTGWKYLDDLQTNINVFRSLQALFQCNSFGWFFGIYIDNDIFTAENENEGRNDLSSGVSVDISKATINFKQTELATEQEHAANDILKIEKNEARRKRYEETKEHINAVRRKKYMEKKQASNFKPNKIRKANSSISTPKFKTIHLSKNTEDLLKGKSHFSDQPHEKKIN